MSLKNFINLFEQKEDPANLLKTFVGDLDLDSADSDHSDRFFQKVRLLLEDEDFKNLRSPVAERAAEFLNDLISTISKEKHFQIKSETTRALYSLCASQWGVLPPPYAFIGQVKKIIPCATQLDLWAVSLDIPDNELPRNLDPNEHHVMWKMTWGSEDVVVEAINYAGFGSPELLEKVPDPSTIWDYQNAKKLLPRRGLCVLSGGLRSEILCIVPAWVKNGNIRTFLKENPQSNRFTLLWTICQGLSYLHAKKFVHGGLNMGNILVYDKKKPRLAEDSGFASAYEGVRRERVQESISEQEWIYMAPEQFQGWWKTSIPKFDEAVDVYALGVLIIEVLTGELPTLIEEAVEARDKKSRPVTFMGDVILKLPPSLPDPDNPIWDLARRCLALSPKKRPKLDEIHQILCDYHLSDFSFRIPPATIDATESSD